MSSLCLAFITDFLSLENTTKMISLVTGKEKTVSTSDVTVLTSKSTRQGSTLVKFQPPSRDVAGTYPVIQYNLTTAERTLNLVPSSSSSDPVLHLPKLTHIPTSASTSVAIAETGNKLGEYQYLDQNNGQIVLQSSDSVQLPSNSLVHVLVQASDSGEQAAAAIGQSGDKIEKVSSEGQEPIVDQVLGSAGIVQEKGNMGL